MTDMYGGEGFAEQLLASRMPDGTLLGDHPDFLRMMVRMNHEINPHGVVTPNAGETPMQTITARISEIQSMMADNNSDYYRGPNSQKLQEEYRQLLEQQDRYQQRNG